VEDLRVGTVPGNADRDIEIYPLNPNGNANHTGAALNTCTDATMPGGCPCLEADLPGAWYVCDAHANADLAPTANGAYGAAAMGEWIPSYNIVAYAIGYVNGKPTHLLRAVIR